MGDTEKILEEVVEQENTEEVASIEDVIEEVLEKTLEDEKLEEAEVPKLNVAESNQYNFNSTELYNVALFIDYENVYKNLLKTNSNPIRDGFFEKVRKWCKDRNRRLVKIAVYCNYDITELHESYHQSLLQTYGVESIHTSNQGKNYADLQITIDVLNAMHINDNIDEFIIMSNDKDMTPLLNSIRYNKKKVSIITTGEDYNQTICSFADEQISYEEIIKEVCDRLIIYSIEDRIYNNLKNLANKNFDEVQKQYKNIKLEYYAGSLFRTVNLMNYEIYNCFKQLSIKNKIYIYEYTYRGSNYLGIVTDDMKDILVTEGIISEVDIRIYDFDAKISELYEKCRPN